MNKIKVAFCVSSFRIGGAEQVVVNLLKELSKDLFDFKIFVLEGQAFSKLEDEIKILNLDVVYLNKKEGLCLKTIWKLYQALKKFRPNIIHAHLGGVLYSLLYAYLNKVTIIQTVHTDPFYEYKKLKRIILKFMYRQKVIIPVGVSTEISNKIKKLYNLSFLPYVIHNGINFALYKRPIHRTSISTIGHIGRLEEVKNHWMIISVFSMLVKKYPNLHLYLVGSGSKEEEIKQQIKDNCLENKVTLLGQIDNVPIVLQAIDLFFMPSYYEGLPLALIEAMASGCVIVASSVGGIKDIIKDDINGYLVDNPYDCEKFFSQINYLINHNEKVLEISKQNIIDAKKYSIEQMGMAYQSLYLDVLSSR
ncbi:MAG TPA: glycosyltransferase [Bacilli bacterium]|nr:glycosyltransferase [Bacilli bacterium]